MIPVILSGGSGTRLWPLSRPMHPKQFLPLTSDKTMFQETVSRIQNITTSSPIIVANNDHRFMVAENLKEFNYDNPKIILEENGRNTAPAIAIACMIALEQDKDAVIMVLPADHNIQNIEAFKNSTLQAKPLAEQGYLVTFGIKPSDPNTEYGYIEIGDPIEQNAHSLKRFKEKPDGETALSYYNSGQYLWNSGMFIFKASTYLSELKKFAPTIFENTSLALRNSAIDLDFIRLSASDFEQCDSISIDRAVMEKTSNGAVVSLDATWCDVGSWDALWAVLPKDENGNVAHGDVEIRNSENSYIHSDNRFVSVLGVKDLIIADTKDALLVAHKNDVAHVKNIVETLHKNNRPEGKHHRTQYRPWGYFDIIDQGDLDEVRRISVSAGKKLSMQKHDYRSEHWVVVKGIATVIKDGETFEVLENESIFIPSGVKHRLENNQNSPLEIIEVKTGNYLGEDDVVRY